MEYPIARSSRMPSGGNWPLTEVETMGVGDTDMLVGSE